MRPTKDPKNKGTNKASEEMGSETKTILKKEALKEESDGVPVDNDAKNYFDAEDKDPELRSDNNRDIPL